jgi:hypothetical protein
MAVKSFVTLGLGSTLADLSTHNPKIKGLNPAIATGRKKMRKTDLMCLKKAV